MFQVPGPRPKLHTAVKIMPLQMRLQFPVHPVSKKQCGRVMYYIVLCINMNLIKWISLNLAMSMSTYKLGLHCYNLAYKPFVWHVRKHTRNVQNYTCVAHKKHSFLNFQNGRSVREEWAVDRKLKSHLEWPNSQTHDEWTTLSLSPCMQNIAITIMGPNPL